MENIYENPEYLWAVHPKEMLYYKLSVLFATIIWIIIVVTTLGISLIYLWIVWIFIVFSHALFLSYIKWYGIKVTRNQFVEIYSLAEWIATKLNMKSVPAIYIYNMDGTFNAFATHFFSRNFIIITTSILDACWDDLEKLRFIMAHEMVHLQRWHTRSQFFLSLARLIPWLSNAYSRACEYTCDGIAWKFILWNKKDAIESVLILPTADKNRAAKINLEAYEEQRAESGSFWMTFTEIKSTHPFSFNRVAYLRSLFWEEVNHIKKSIFWILLSPIFRLQTFIMIYIGIFLGLSVAWFFEGYNAAKNKETSNGQVSEIADFDYDYTE